MIVVKLMGGLGNQMFQYAFARYLALKNNTSVKTDSSIYKTHQWAKDEAVRKFELDVFNVSAQEASKDELSFFKKGKLTKIYHYGVLRLGIRSSKLYIREPYFHFFKRALKAKSFCYLDGYWQSEKYFSSIREVLLKDFTLKHELNPSSEEILQKIKACESVSVHVRKTDYIKGSVNSKIYGEITPQYYLQAMSKVKEKYSNASFFVFSDDSEWFKKNISTDLPVTFVDFNRGDDSYQDLYLMSQCKHNIIANSSFSWWGAWLNTNAQKMVIAPQNWFQKGAHDGKDLIPKSWIKL